MFNKIDLGWNMDIAKQVGESMKKQFDDLELEYEVHLSKINNEGIKTV